MEKYILKAEDQEIAKEALELFSSLGYELGKSDRSGMIFTQDGKATCDRLEFWNYYKNQEGCQELTIPQLRDLVVLKRNDYTDATPVDQDGWKWFISSDNISYVFGAGNSQGLPRWDESPLDHVDLTPMQKPQKNQDQCLISGAEALRALADGKEVECQNKQTFEWFNCRSLSVAELVEGTCKYRVKPQTIKLELEIPAPFEPKDGERYFYLNPYADAGYGENTTTKWSKYLQFGAWRTEEEINQVVKQLRKIRGAS
ncbi:hypothetical protein [Acinetobacter lactucae]|uniref:hypothetical protein n=1 Tax=Acinetobacter lactucae TaxID=1785128 RepID=UPI00157FF5A1|nr:hypothetical protein [Acinetobacter lactucae]NUG21194.1 hypothetical protein [Acinetobacter lactucae]